MALYCSAIVMKSFIIVVEIVTAKLKASLLLNELLRIHPLTFINKVLRLSGSPFVASTASP